MHAPVYFILSGTSAIVQNLPSNRTPPTTIEIIIIGLCIASCLPAHSRCFAGRYVSLLV